MSVLKGIQQAVVDRLSSEQYFSNIPVLSENLGDIEAAIQTAIAKLGVCVIVVTPTASAAFPDYLKAYFDKITIVCRCVENVTLNRSAAGTRKPASDVAEMVAAILHNYEPTGISENIFLDTPSISIAPNGGVGKLLSYDVRLRTAGGFDYTISKVETPVISFAGDTFALACNTPGAAIFYTTDGSSPSPSNPVAQVWNGHHQFGTYDIPSGVSSGVLTGLGLDFTPSVVVMTVSSDTGQLTLVVSETGSITSDGWGFSMNGITDSNLYVLNWTAFSSNSMVTVSSGAKVRATAWLAGMLTSDEAKATAP